MKIGYLHGGRGPVRVREAGTVGLNSVLGVLLYWEGMQ